MRSGRGEAVYPFERFSERAKRTLVLAQEEAERTRRSYIGTEHLLLGLIGNQGATAGRVLGGLGLAMEDLRETIQRALHSTEAASGGLAIPTAQVKKVIEKSFEEAQRTGCSYVGTEHLLVGLVVEGEGLAATVLRDRGVTADRVREETSRLLAEGSHEEPS